MGRRGQTGSGGAVVSSLSGNSGGTVKGKKGKKEGKGRGANDDEFDFVFEDAAGSGKKKRQGGSASGAGGAASAEGAAASGSGSASQSAGWIGKTPVILLREWCLRNDRKRPVIKPAGGPRGSDGTMRCFVPAGKRSDPVKKKGFEQIFGMGEKPGEEFAALNVLHQVEHGKPLHTLMAPVFRPTWIDMDARFKEVKQSQEKAAFRAAKNKKFAERNEKAAKNAESATISISTASRDAIDDALQGAMAKPEFSVVGSGSSSGAGSDSQTGKVKAKLVAFGFAPLDAASAAERFSNVNDALDYLCLTLDEAELPASFAPPGDIEVVQFHKSGSSSGSLRPNPVHAEQLCARLCVSRLAAEKALRATDGSTCGALGVLFRSFTNSRFRGIQSAEEDEELVRQAITTAQEERSMEQEAVQAIYGDDVKVGVGVLKDYPTAWAVCLSMASGIPGLAIRGPVDVCVVDVDGLYPLTPPAVFIGPGDEKIARARRRAAMRAAAAEIESLRADFGVELSDLEPVHVTYSVASLLAESSEANLLASAASSRPTARGPTTSESTPAASKVSGDSKHSRKNRRPQGQHAKTQPPRWRTPRPVPASKANPKALAAMSAKRRKLPAFNSRLDIIDVVKQNQVTVVSGATGSGKTTQVPQFLLEDARQSGEPISIVCTQPRRIAAMSVAERVAAERCEQIGHSVGYQVKLNRKKSDDTRLVFCTTGVLLRQMQSDPELDGLTHILVDEVHERSVDTDFVLLLIRDILPRRPSLRVVLMSATLDASKISSYFSSFINKPVPVLSIPGRTFPVTELFLEDAVALTRYRLKEGDRYAKKKWVGGRQVSGSDRNVGAGPRRGALSSNSATLAAQADDPAADDEDVPDDWEDADGDGGSDIANPDGRSASHGATRGDDVSKFVEENIAATKLIDDSLVNVDLIEALVCKLDAETQDRSAGAILVFLPGMAEISAVVERLSRGRGASRLFAMPLHSAVSPDAQKAIFGPAPKGRRKVICSTNIAETSVTVEDVTIVIDTGRVKEMSYDALNRTSVLAETFISQAAARQRSGRAGRVSKGTCYRLVRKATFEHTFQAQQEPEIRRIALEHLVLNLLGITPSGSVARDPQQFLEKALDPPKAEAVAVAVWNLTALGALEPAGGEGSSGGGSKSSGAGGAVSLTALGRHLSCLPVDARIGKLLIYGTLFGCQDASLTIAATLSERSPFFSPRDKREESRRVREKFKWGQSDLLMFVRVFEAWEEVKTSGFRAQADFCDTNFLSRKTMVAIGDGRAQLRGQLTDAGFGSDMNGGGGLNRNNGDVRVVRGVVCAALYPNVLRIDTPEQKYEQKRGGAVAKESFNAKEIKLRSKPDRRGGGGRDMPQSSGERAFLHPESINFDEGNYSSRWLAYFSKVKTSRVFVRDATMVSPYAILLFGGEIEVRHEQGQLVVDGWMVFKAPARVAVLVRELRRNLDSMLLRKFDDPGVDIEDAQSRAVSDAILRLIREERG